MFLCMWCVLSQAITQSSSVGRFWNWYVLPDAFSKCRDQSSSAHDRCCNWDHRRIIHLVSLYHKADNQRGYKFLVTVLVAECNLVFLTLCSTFLINAIGVKGSGAFSWWLWELGSCYLRLNFWKKEMSVQGLSKEQITVSAQLSNWAFSTLEVKCLWDVEWNEAGAHASWPFFFNCLLQQGNLLPN